MVHDSNGASTIIKQPRSSQPNKGLEVHIAHNTTQWSEFEFRIKQCQGITAKASAAHLTLEESYSMMHQQILTKVTYLMPVSTFNLKQCKSMNTVIDEVMLNEF